MLAIIAGITLTLYAIIVPGLLAIALARSTRRERELGRHFVPQFGWMYKRFEMRLFWWHMVVIVRQILIIGLQVTIADSPAGEQFG